jgi:hypothetical protein
MQTSRRIFDIFRLQPDGSGLHIGESASSNVALIDVEMFASKVPAEYGGRRLLAFEDRPEGLYK